MTATPTEISRAVPFLDLAPAHRPLKDAILEDVAALIDTGAFTNGPAVAKFEAAFASYCDAAHCIGVGSGLDALRLGLLAAGLKPGDEVIVPALTFVATLEAVTQAGGHPVVVDVTETDYNIDPSAIAAACGPRTRFVMPVHLYGQLADMRTIRPLAAASGLAIVEDACQAHGARRDGIAAGSGATAAAFSFYPGKNLGAFGDGGALVTDDPQLAAHMRALREHGQVAKYEHQIEGYTSRLDTLQAHVLLRKLALLDEWNGQRRDIAALYTERLAGVGDLILPPQPEGSEPVWHLYVVRTEAVDALQAFLTARKIGTGRHYPTPVHLTTAYEWLGYTQGSFPVAEGICEGLLSLPIYPGMTPEHAETVVEAIHSFFGDVA